GGDTEAVENGSSGDRRRKPATNLARFRLATSGDRCREWRFNKDTCGNPTVYFSPSRLAMHNFAWRQSIL
ncbi:hypothetical protein A2U01_0099717, partial [Trifolium medium]|nr:hypothetical protein [Trifolium medium]